MSTERQRGVDALGKEEKQMKERRSPSKREKLKKKEKICLENALTIEEETSHQVKKEILMRQHVEEALQQPGEDCNDKDKIRANRSKLRGHLASQGCCISLEETTD